MPNPDAEAIADLIDACKTHWITASTAMLLVNVPQMNQALMDFTKGDLGSVAAAMRPDGSAHRLGAYIPAMLEMQKDSATFNLQFMIVSFSGYVSMVGDRLSGHGYFDRDPLLNFFRHVRNAVSHGNQFYFKGQEPKDPAQFQSKILSQADHGGKLFFEYLYPGELFDLFDEVAAHLRAL